MFNPYPGTAESELDLRGRRENDALVLLGEALEESSRQGHEALLVRFDPATATSGPTLFQPVGKLLVDAKKRGIVSHCHPLIEEDSGGFYVVFQK